MTKRNHCSTLNQRPKTSKLAASEQRRINLNGKDVAYILMRCRRKTIGMKINSEGLTVRIPPREPLCWVESVLQKRADWIVKKLDEWKNKKSSKPDVGRRCDFSIAGRALAGGGYYRRGCPNGSGHGECRGERKSS